MSWFESLTGFTEESPEYVRERLTADGPFLRSRQDDRFWRCGEFETPTLAQLRERVRNFERDSRRISVRELVADVQQLHLDDGNANAMFQVASQFNLLEMTSPGVTPERGVGIYERDRTQGPACAIAAGAGTIFRNYFVDVDGVTGQSANHQIDCLDGIGALLDNSGQRIWKMTNGYALPSAEGLTEIHRKLETLDAASVDRLRQALKIGLQWQTQVTLDGASHFVSQAYCSGMPVAYTRHTPELWAPFATLVLEAAYEATVCAAIVNADRTGNNQLYLTLLGGGVFGNDFDWIMGAIRRSLEIYGSSGLDVAIVSYGRSRPVVKQLEREFA